MGKHIQKACIKGCGYTGRSNNVRTHEQKCTGPLLPCGYCGKTLENFNHNKGAFVGHLKACATQTAVKATQVSQSSTTSGLAS